MSERPPAPASEEAELRALREALAEAEKIPELIAHELRSPIGAMLILTSVIRQDCAGMLDENGRALLERLQGCVRGTAGLMERLTLFSHVRRVKLEPVAVDLHAEIRAAWASQTPPEGLPLPELTVHELPLVVADPALLRLLLVNLLANAVKCTARRKEPRVEVGEASAATGAGGASESCFFVRDNGMGFDPAHASRLFTLFGRLHAQAEVRGAGVGLAIVRHIVQRHGGRVWAEGHPYQGATFFVALPRPRQVVSEGVPAA